MAKKKDFPKTLLDDVLLEDENLTDEVEELMQSLRIDPNGLTEEASNHPDIFARWAILAEEAAASVRFIKRDKDLRVAELDSIVRVEIEERGEKITEAKVQNEISSHKDITDLSNQLLDAERTAGILNAVRQSLAHRRDMILELMRDRRKEAADD